MGRGGKLPGMCLFSLVGFLNRYSDSKEGLVYDNIEIESRKFFH